jgi:cysteine synthase
MDNQDLLSKLKFYEERIGLLEKELDETKTHLKKYTAPSNMKKYYETHKEEIKQRVKEYREKTNYIVSKDVIKERNKRAYQRRKEKLEKEKTENI